MFTLVYLTEKKNNTIFILIHSNQSASINSLVEQLVGENRFHIYIIHINIDDWRQQPTNASITFTKKNFFSFLISKSWNGMYFLTSLDIFCLHHSWFKIKLDVMLHLCYKLNTISNCSWTFKFSLFWIKSFDGVKHHNAEIGFA